MADKERLVAIPRLLDLNLSASLGIPRCDHSHSSTAAAQLGSSSKSSSVKNESKRRDDTNSIDHESVYARPFVPTILKDINNVSCATVRTAPKHFIDFPAYVSSFAAHSFLPERVKRKTGRPVTYNVLREESYERYFMRLAGIEHVAKCAEHDDYTIYMTQVLPAGPVSDNTCVFSLSIPGIREDRPLIEVGDIVRLRQLNVDYNGTLSAFGHQMWIQGTVQEPRLFQYWQGFEYEAVVSSVNRAHEIAFVMIEGLIPTTMVFNVLIPVKQWFLRAQELALKHVSYELCMSTGSHASGASSPSPLTSSLNDWTRRMLFPTEQDGKLLQSLRSVAGRGMFDPKLNYEQIQAADTACTDRYGVLPLLISGPPGTGKTKTLVEIAMQLLQHSDVTSVFHILICAPSDQAADTLTQRLRQYMTIKQLFRLIGPQRSDIEVPQDILPYCYRKAGSQDMFDLPPPSKLMSYNVVVTSARDASILVEARVTNSDLYFMEKEIQTTFHPENPHYPESLHWGALLVDESAQATEPEILPALCVIMAPSDFPVNLPQPRLIMAGDENQLGPQTASRESQLATSLFARLLQRSLYASHPLARSNTKPSLGAPTLKASMLPMIYPPFVNLTRNYRSHPSIISVPSSLFYADTLIPEATLEQTPLQYSSLWQGEKWPVLFVPIIGADEIERDGGGWYNMSEVREACDIAQDLVYSSSVQPKDIIIMSPFAAQVKRLRAAMRSSRYGGGAGLWDVNIGPLEAFQGLEGRVVILCTTRTRKRFLETDTQKGMGIVGLKRKLNVALTRAKAGLVVLGNSDVLGTDAHWVSWMAFCWRNGLVRGNPFGDELVDAFKGCKIGILEKALLFRKHRDFENGRVLGAAAPVNVVGEDEMWTAGFSAALEELELEYDDGDGEYGEPEGEEKEEKVEHVHEQ